MSPAMADPRSEPPSFHQASHVNFVKNAQLQNGHTGEPDFYDGAEPSGELMDLDWASELRNAPGVEPVMTAGALLSPDSKMPADHLFTALLHHRLLRDLTCFYERPAQALHTLVALGPDVCGHGGLVHGGMSATVMDETLGALVYVLKRDGALGSGPAFTAHLEVDYKKPIPAPANVLCTAKLTSIEGRKIWLAAEILDRPGGVAYATGKALFVVPRQQQQQAAGNGAGDGAVAAGAAR